MAPARPDRDSRQAVFVISVAAELAGVHPQTLRIYERKGLVDPARTGGGSRRYSEEDIERLRRIQDLTNEGLNLAGVKRVIELEAELERLQSQLAEAQREARDALSGRTAPTGATWCRCRRRWSCSASSAADRSFVTVR
jgi:MerR family transcriptional regulator/heat shock protein HspR